MDGSVPTSDQEASKSDATERLIPDVDSKDPIGREVNKESTSITENPESFLQSSSSEKVFDSADRTVIQNSLNTSADVPADKKEDTAQLESLETADQTKEKETIPNPEVDFEQTLSDSLGDLSLADDSNERNVVHIEMPTKLPSMGTRLQRVCEDGESICSRAATPANLKTVAKSDPLEEALNEDEDIPVDSTISPKGLSALELRYSSLAPKDPAPVSEAISSSETPARLDLASQLKDPAVAFIPDAPQPPAVPAALETDPTTHFDDPTVFFKSMVTKRLGKSRPVPSPKVGSALKTEKAAKSSKMRKTISFSNNVERKNSQEQLEYIPMAAQGNDPSDDGGQPSNAQWDLSRPSRRPTRVQGTPSIGATGTAAVPLVAPNIPPMAAGLGGVGGMNPLLVAQLQALQASQNNIGGANMPQLGQMALSGKALSTLTRPQSAQQQQQKQAPAMPQPSRMKKAVSFAEEIIEPSPHVSFVGTAKDGSGVQDKAVQGNAQWNLGPSNAAASKFRLNRPTSLVGLEYALNNISIEKSAGGPSPGPRIPDRFSLRKKAPGVRSGGTGTNIPTIKESYDNEG